MTQWTILLHLLSSGIILRMDLILSLTAVNTANSFPLHMMETNPGPTILIISRAKSEAAHNLGARVILNNQSFDMYIYICVYIIYIYIGHGKVTVCGKFASGTKEPNVCSRLCRNCFPKVKQNEGPGAFSTCSMLWLKPLPNAKLFFRFSGKVTP